MKTLDKGEPGRFSNGATGFAARPAGPKRCEESIGVDGGMCCPGEHPAIGFSKDPIPRAATAIGRVAQKARP